MIEKPSIIITSLGRTGTKFFAHLFTNLLPDISALHEPDIIKLGRGESLYRQIQLSGVYNLIIRKGLKRWSLIELSDKRFIQDVNTVQATKQLLAQRADFIAERSGLYYLESNSGYYGLIDCLPETFQHYRTIYIVRNGHAWVRSWMNWGHAYNKGWIRQKLGHGWPKALDIPDDPYATQWPMMSRVERLCWAWNTLNRYALTQIQANPLNACIFRFEDIFQAPNRYENLQTLVDFSTTFPNYGKLETKVIDGWLEKQVHQSTGSFPKWPQWSQQEKAYFQMMCGDLMHELGYEN